MVHGFIAGLRDGQWVTRERMRRIALALLAVSGMGLLFLLATSDGLNDYRGRPLGTDFSNVYTAGTYVLESNAAAPFDPARQHVREQAIFGAATPFYGWHYPPFFLLVAGLLALLPYGIALLVWQASTLALYLAVIGKVVARAGPARDGADRAFPPAVQAAADRQGSERNGQDRLWLLLALAYPAVFVNLGHGHNGFLTAALLTAALVNIGTRPLLAGALFGLLAYKPQFGLMIPLVLAAGGYWRTFAAAAVTVALLAGATTFAFGPDVWRAFLASTAFTREVALEQGNTGWHKIQSVFAWVRMWGGPVPLAYAIQGAVTLAIGAGLIALWRSAAAFPLKAAALCVATILATPYSLDYDMMVLAPAIAFLAAHGMRVGFAPYEKRALALLWIAPLIARSVTEMTLIPLGVTLMLALFALILRKGLWTQQDLASPSRASLLPG
jgi:hypothetical protein